MTLAQGDHVTSLDERDEPSETWVVIDADVPHVSGPVAKIKPLHRPVWFATYRLAANLRRNPKEEG
jgi:hypothetical protein